MDESTDSGSPSELTPRDPSVELLWRMKRQTHRAKDQGDLAFLRELFAAQGRQPPE